MQNARLRGQAGAFRKLQYPDRASFNRQQLNCMRRLYFLGKNRRFFSKIPPFCGKSLPSSNKVGKNSCLFVVFQVGTENRFDFFPCLSCVKLDHAWFCPRLIEIESSTNERLCIFMMRAFKYVFGLTFFDDFAVLHHHHIIGHGFDDRQIMADENIGQAVL